MPNERVTGDHNGAADRLEGNERLYRMFVKDLVLQCNIGAYAHERLAPQPVRFNVDLHVREPAVPLNDDLRNVLSYDEITAGIKRLIGRGHINLVETLAEEIASLCLADPRALHVRVSVEKLAVEPNATSVGVEIERRRRRHPAVAELFPLAFESTAALQRGRRDGGN